MTVASRLKKLEGNGGSCFSVVLCRVTYDLDSGQAGETCREASARFGEETMSFTRSDSEALNGFQQRLENEAMETAREKHPTAFILAPDAERL